MHDDLVAAGLAACGFQLRGTAATVRAPGRVVSDPIGRIGDHQLSLRSCQYPLDIGGAGAVAAQIVWAKQHFTLSRGDYHWKHECCWYAVREGKTSHWQADRTQTTVGEVPQ